jgi:TolB protein
MKRTASPSRLSSSRLPSALLLGAAGLLIAGLVSPEALAALPNKVRSRATRLLMAGPSAHPAQQPPPPAVQPPAAGQPPTVIIHGQSQQRFAIPDCVPRVGDEASREACRTVASVLRKDLQFEALFQFVPESLFSALPAGSPDAPNFEDWRSVGANFLVVTRAQVTGGELAVDLKVYSVDGRQTMLTKRYAGRADNPRVFAHMASDDIMTLTQYRGVARSRIAFTSDRDATRERRTKELYIMDYDGFNPKRFTVNRSLNILPAWSPDGRALAYVSYRQTSPDVFLASIFEGKSLNLTQGKGQSFAPSFSPDGKRVAFASSRSGNFEIWVANVDGTSPRKITNSAASETAPSWSPTGAEIAFTSDRAGGPQIYVMDSEGLNVRRLTTVGNWNDAPAWNPSKEYSEIAYTSRLEAGGFDIAVVDLATRQVRQVTSGRGSCEYPSWAPSGRHLVFSCKRGASWQITVSDREGRRVDTLAAGPGNNVQPDWGP